MTTETLDKLYLEWSQFTKARTAREIELEAKLATERERCAKILEDMMSSLKLEPTGHGFPNWSDDAVAGIFFELIEKIREG